MIDACQCKCLIDTLHIKYPELQVKTNIMEIWKLLGDCSFAPSCICNALHKTLRIFGLRFPVKWRSKQHVCATNKVANNASIKVQEWTSVHIQIQTSCCIHWKCMEIRLRQKWYPPCHSPSQMDLKLKTPKFWHQVAGKSCGWLRMSRQRPHIDRTWRTRESPPKTHNMDTIASIKHRFLVLGSRYQHDSKCLPWRRTYHHINLWMFSVNQIESQIYDDLCVWTQRSWNP